MMRFPELIFWILTLTIPAASAQVNSDPIQDIAGGATPESSAVSAEGFEDKEATPTPVSGKVRRGSDKDTEGTKAPNRFQGDTVIKSQYHLDGEPLEVDPD